MTWKMSRHPWANIHGTNTLFTQWRHSTSQLIQRSWRLIKLFQTYRMQWHSSSSAIIHETHRAGL